MHNKNSSIKAFLPRAIIIATMALSITAMGLGSNNPRHQRHTGTSDLGKGYTVFQTFRKAL